MLVNTNDRVVIVAPASQLRSADSELLQEGVSLLESWGLVVDTLMPSQPHFYLAGKDEVRAGHLIDALCDVRYKVVFCLRGGYGSLRLARELEGLEGVTSKALVGFSDITTLHLIGRRYWPNVTLIHGPNIATKQLLGKEEHCDVTRKSLHNLLFSSEYQVREHVEFLKEGEGSGPLVGGCLTMVASSLGTDHALETADAILFLEDVGEAPFKIDRMLTQLKLAGLFNDVKGVVFGEMKNCADPYNDLRDVISDTLGMFNFPIAYGLRSGHGSVNLSLPLGAAVKLSSETQRLDTC